MKNQLRLADILSDEYVRQERTESIETYIAGWGDTDVTEAVMIADQLPGEPFANTIVIIPVAAHTEAPNVYRALAEYSRQIECEPFSIHLHVNHPIGLSDESGIEQTMHEILRAHHDFPHLDLRLSGAQYQSAPIGRIRRAIWNGTLLKAYEQNGSLSDIIGLNHDIDLMRLSSRYISRVQKFYSNRDLPDKMPAFLPVALTETKHYPSSDHANTNRAVYWSDFTARMLGVGFEAGIVIPFATYALSGGFNPEHETHETRSFASPSQYSHPIIRGTSLQTSIRRHLDRLDTYGYGEVWTPDSFGPDDRCRNRHEFFADMSEDRMQQLVRESAIEFAQTYMRRHFAYKLSRRQKLSLRDDDGDPYEKTLDSISAETGRISKMSQFVLDRLLHVEGVSNFLHEHYFGAEPVRQRAEASRFRFRENQRILQMIIAENPDSAGKYEWSKLGDLL